VLLDLFLNLLGGDLASGSETHLKVRFDAPAGAELFLVVIAAVVQRASSDAELAESRLGLERPSAACVRGDVEAVVPLCGPTCDAPGGRVLGNLKRDHDEYTVLFAKGLEGGVRSDSGSLSQDSCRSRASRFDDQR